MAQVIHNPPNTYKEPAGLSTESSRSPSREMIMSWYDFLPDGNYSLHGLGSYNPTENGYTVPVDVAGGRERVGLESTYISRGPVSQFQSRMKSHPSAHLSNGSGSHPLQRGYPATLGSGANDHNSSESVPSTSSTPVADPPRMDSIYTPNIVIFGGTGVGKSSVINLIAGQKVARTSNSALGCTFQHDRHVIKLGDMQCALWDTTGLDEGSEGTVPAALAESSLKELVRALARTGGINLVVYCIRAGRFTKALQRNYHLFYVTVCRKKVPVALVVTGLEHQEDGMETWWDENEGDLRRSGMHFDAHACVTTLDDENRIIRMLRNQSQKRLRELVLEYSMLPPWKIDSLFISWVLPTFRSVLRRTLSTRRGSDRTIRRVVVCDMDADSQSPCQFSPGITAVWQRFDGMIGNQQYEFVRVDKHVLQTPTSPSQPVGGGGAGVLVFYTSPLDDTGIPYDDVASFKKFYAIAGGQIRPVIVVLRGCPDEETAQTLWNDVSRRDNNVYAHVTFLPRTVDGRSDAQAMLNVMIERLCIEQVEISAPRTGKRILAAFVDAVPDQIKQAVAKKTKPRTTNI